MFSRKIIWSHFCRIKFHASKSYPIFSYRLFNQFWISFAWQSQRWLSFDDYTFWNHATMGYGIYYRALETGKSHQWKNSTKQFLNRAETVERMWIPCAGWYCQQYCIVLNLEPLFWNYSNLPPTRRPASEATHAMGMPSDSQLTRIACRCRNRCAIFVISTHNRALLWTVSNKRFPYLLWAGFLLKFLLIY